MSFLYCFTNRLSYYFFSEKIIKLSGYFLRLLIQPFNFNELQTASNMARIVVTFVEYNNKYCRVNK